MKAITLAAILSLAACSAPHPGARSAGADDSDLNPSGKPYQGPHAIRSTFPPGDTSFTPLTCHIDGPGQVCAR